MSGAPPAGAAELPAAGSSFYLGMRVLPKPQREAMYAVYGFCRAVDDVADAGDPATERKAGLNRWRRDIDLMFAGSAPAHLAALSAARDRFRLPPEPFHHVIDGMQMDVDADIQAPDWATLDLYCDRVASAVGRMSTRIFGLPDGAGDELAHHLGLALQLTNILRDIDDDAVIGRLYLPREALLRAGMTDLSPASVAQHPRLGDVCEELAARAREHFAEAGRIMDGQPRALVRAPRLMAAAYRSVLDRLVRRGFAPPRPRVSTSRLAVLGALLRYGLL